MASGIGKTLGKVKKTAPENLRGTMGQLLADWKAKLLADVPPSGDTAAPAAGTALPKRPRYYTSFYAYLCRSCLW